MGSQRSKKDIFGRVVKEKFPYYPYSVIIPRCGPGPPCASNRSKRKGNGVQKLDHENCTPEEIQVECRGQEIRSRPKYPAPGTSQSTQHDRQQNSTLTSGPRSVNTAELCRRIADIVAKEIPLISDKFLEEIQEKCKCYWDCLIKHKVYLDEEAVFELLAQKIREWSEKNSLHEAEVTPEAPESVEFVEGEEDLEELYGTIVKFSESHFNSQAQLFDDQDE